MARRRGFFAELQHQAAVAERNKQRAETAAARQAQTQHREAERAAAAARRAAEAAARADSYARVAALQEAERLHAAAQVAQVEALNAQLKSELADIDSVLSWTLGVDDHVDLNELRRVANHPDFASAHQQALRAPQPLTLPPEPVFVEPDGPTGLGAVFGKRKHAAAVEGSRAEFERRLAAWRAEAAAVPMRQHDQMTRHQAADAERQRKLQADRAAYDSACHKRQQQVDAHNAQIDALIAKLEARDPATVEEYFGIVFSNSVYPDSISADTSMKNQYDSRERELELTVALPAPSTVPTVRSYRYVKAKDEITETPQPLKEQKDRYNNLVWALVVRIVHEVWESDRLGHVDTVALTAGVDHLDPATGHMKRTPLVAMAVTRAAFEELDLAHVTPVETLKHLGAVVSKNPHALSAINLADGVRG